MGAKWSGEGGFFLKFFWLVFLFFCGVISCLKLVFLGGGLRELFFL